MDDRAAFGDTPEIERHGIFLSARSCREAVHPFELAHSINTASTGITFFEAQLTLCMELEKSTMDRRPMLITAQCATTRQAKKQLKCVDQRAIPTSGVR
jgi:hypothetical protein